MVNSFLKEELHPKIKFSMFCGLFQNHQHFFWKVVFKSWSKLSEKLKTYIQISIGQAVLGLIGQNVQNIGLTNNSSY